MKILVCDPISDDAVKLLRQSRDVVSDYRPDITAAQLLEVVKDYEGLILRSRTKITREVIFGASRLKVIGRAGVGIDNIDASAASERNVKILNTPDALTNAVAEFTVGLMLDLARQIPRADASIRKGEWSKSAFNGIELRGRTYGTIGIGRIGQKVAEIAYAFGMKIMANDIIPIPKILIENLDVVISTQDQVFEQADFVDLHVPLTPETEHLVNYEKLRRMKKTSFLINTSRGKVVDEKGLLRALNEGLISGAALDVFEIEPLARSDLLENEKVVITPHIAGQTEEAQLKAGIQVVEEVLKYLRTR